MNLHASFLKRVGLENSGQVQFEDLERILKAFSLTIPFENFGILDNKKIPLTAESLSFKILEQRRGGVCYELNPLLYYFLTENHLDVQLIQGTVYNHAEQKWSLSGTHAAILLSTDSSSYLLDSGFGTNVAQKPIPMNGEMTESATGKFRIREKSTSEGSHLLEMRLDSEQQDSWKIGYAFHADRPLNLTDLYDIQAKIHDNPDSPFNKKPLAAMRTETGVKTLSEASFSVTEDGRTEKHPLSAGEFQKMAEKEFGLQGLL
ncbi:arylamine N-acetyltransferase [Bacillus sp. FJAT-42376]|uniref:arylamine N-acetyltransferase family protein n=1 Tax=Bacillus sp. FJAT-42376 TaxID=2014076 RepID=UPI000F4D9E13|nr:arylamine N-acetyltransferase [Bacillus sp. FJAT-42376]AZB40952.1 arylamine N-acetyltransferase [Bacillus sp. FJAT-42376]